MRLRKVRRVLPPEVTKAVSGMPEAMKEGLTAAVRKGATATVTRRNGRKTEVKMDGKTYRVLVSTSGDRARVAAYPGKGASAKADAAYDGDVAAHPGATTYMAEGEASLVPTMQMAKDAVGDKPADKLAWCEVGGECVAVGDGLFSMKPDDFGTLFGGAKPAPAAEPTPAGQPAAQPAPARPQPAKIPEPLQCVRLARGLVEDLARCKYGISIATIAEAARAYLDSAENAIVAEGGKE